MVRASEAIEILTDVTVRANEIQSFDQWKEFQAQSKNEQWLYLYSWENPGFFAWGTSSGKSDRIRKAGLFHRSMTGKYDRRIDYLIAKRLYGMPRIWVFEAKLGEKATSAESLLRNKIQGGNIHHCFHGIPGGNRLEIAQNFLDRLRRSSCYLDAEEQICCRWERFVSDVYLAFPRIPTADGNGWRTFYWGDSLEPNFLSRKLGLSELAPAVSYMLDIDYFG